MQPIRHIKRFATVRRHNIKGDNMTEGVIQIWAAMSPQGEIVKSSIGSFRVHAMRYAQTRKNFTVVKLAEIKANVQGTLKRQPEKALGKVEIQKVETQLEVPQHEDRRVIRRRSPAGGRGRAA